MVEVAAQAAAWPTLEGQGLVVILFLLTQTLVAVAGFFLVYTLRRVDSTLDGLDNRIDGHETRISRLEGYSKHSLKLPT